MKTFNMSDFSKDHQAMIELMKNDLLIVLINRLGGKIDIPVAEIDDAGRFMLEMELNPETKVFSFEVGTKTENVT